MQGATRVQEPGRHRGFRALDLLAHAHGQTERRTDIAGAGAGKPKRTHNNKLAGRRKGSVKVVAMAEMCRSKQAWSRNTHARRPQPPSTHA
jgi:hypothetical protein